MGFIHLPVLLINAFPQCWSLRMAETPIPRAMIKGTVMVP
ncbi:hypothetical protein AR1Y2_3083 [Anaerostipes rhamnosivorans]|uniref:Uncharacterized protein n=1 Tax=Anaerostipes rhamnosivorans TaxID=1229621 RepID=A0A4P8II52_9FIRM|nr:hypothetical protein AR1Y2_3083 [Anaerostipes rhamnosivorans]